MQASQGVGLFLPLGVWLVLLAGVPHKHEQRAAAAGLLALAASSLAFFAVGFGLAYGGMGVISSGTSASPPPFPHLFSMMTLPMARPMLGLFGMSGFFPLAGLSADEWALFLRALPVCQTCALVVAFAIYRGASWLAQALVAVAVSLIWSLVACWLWGNGWLAALGAAFQFGHGAVDIGGLSATGLVAGTCALMWAWLGPRRTAGTEAQLAPASFPFRAMAGAVLALVGAGTLSVVAMAGASAHTTQLVVAAGVSVVLAMGYAAFATREANVLLGARAALAAMFAISAGAVLLPMSVVVGLGALAAVSVVFGQFIASHRFNLDDEASIVGGVFAPSLIGLLAVGAFASGEFGAGFNGVGASSHIGQAGVGVVGALPLGNAPRDFGQFSAQVIGIVAMMCVTGVAFAPVAWLARRTWRAAPAEMARSTANISAPTAQLSLPLLGVTHEVAQPTPAPAGAAPATPPASKDPARESMLAWLKRIQRERDRPAAPQQARKVAYPTRVRGKRLFVRPIVEEPAKPAEAANSEP